MLRRLLQNESTKENVVAFSKSMNLKHCLRNAWNKLWIVSKELENEIDTDQKNINDFVDLFNDIPGFHDCNYDDAVDWSI